ncbi:unnamed protein product [Owenia fusiformis]|uniref:Acyl-CoA-binding domain-containing protein 6 n=1 Tax=Owenia fusiformis TaxID=6347 RepID=A0A8J1UZ61_OWEFU|nr:unnamed protein product [Owenia fusiformis]
MAEIEEEIIEDVFTQASEHLKSISTTLETEQLLFFYSRYKQAKEGPCNIPKPGFFDFQGKQKWEAWKKLGDKPKEEAMDEYVHQITSIDPEWRAKVTQGGTQPPKKSIGMGVAVSTMSSPDEHIEDKDKTVFEWCAEGNVEQVAELLEKKNVKINGKDSEGMALLHWASDRGLEEMVKVLLQHEADINAQDNDGQTALHYACSCEHTDVVRLLVNSGADRKLKDLDNLTALDSTDNKEIIELLNGGKT